MQIIHLVADGVAPSPLSLSLLIWSQRFNQYLATGRHHREEEHVWALLTWRVQGMRTLVKMVTQSADHEKDMLVVFEQ